MGNQQPNCVSFDELVVADQDERHGSVQMVKDRQVVRQCEYFMTCHYPWIRIWMAGVPSSYPLCSFCLPEHRGLETFSNLFQRCIRPTHRRYRLLCMVWTHVHARRIHIVVSFCPLIAKRWKADRWSALHLDLESSGPFSIWSNDWTRFNNLTLTLWLYESLWPFLDTNQHLHTNTPCTMGNCVIESILSSHVILHCDWNSVRPSHLWGSSSKHKRREKQEPIRQKPEQHYERRLNKVTDRCW